MLSTHSLQKITMKSKVLPLLTGAIALSLSVASAVPAFSQSTPPTTPTQHQRHKNFLNLTPDQQTRIKQVRQDERTAIDNILTADQKAQLKAEHQNHEARQANRGTPKTGEQRRSPFASLNLTADQRTRIEAAQRTARAQMDTILTPEQRQQMQQHMKQHQQANPSAS